MRACALVVMRLLTWTARHGKGQARQAMLRPPIGRQRSAIAREAGRALARNTAASPSRHFPFCSIPTYIVPR